MPIFRFARGASGAVAGCLAVAALTGCAVGQSAGACAAPVASASPTTVAPSEQVTVGGEYWQPCNDTNHSSEEPWPAVSVEWEQADERLSLGEIAISDGAFTGDVAIPRGAAPGDAVIRIRGGDADLEIAVVVADE